MVSSEMFIHDDGTMEVTDPSLPRMFKIGDRVQIAINGKILDGWWEITPTGMESVKDPKD